LAVHCYQNSAEACEGLVRWYENKARAWGVPEVWVTEFSFFSCNGWGLDYALAEAGKFRAWLDAEPMVRRFAWFQARYKGNEPWSFGPECNTSLVNWTTGDLTVFGEAYR
jgi:hypothetical protein